MKRFYIIFGASVFGLTIISLAALEWLLHVAREQYQNYKNIKVDTMSNNTFSAQSEARLATVHPTLQALARRILTRMDVAVLCGHRNEAEQNAAYNAGTSRLKFPESKHNGYPSDAIDLAPYPINWNNIQAFEHMLQVAKEEAANMGISIRCGGDWIGFKDYPHIELA